MIVLIKTDFEKDSKEKEHHFENMKKNYEEALSKYEEQMEIQQK